MEGKTATSLAVNTATVSNLNHERGPEPVTLVRAPPDVGRERIGAGHVRKAGKHCNKSRTTCVAPQTEDMRKKCTTFWYMSCHAFYCVAYQLFMWLGMQVVQSKFIVCCTSKFTGPVTMIYAWSIIDIAMATLNMCSHIMCSRSIKGLEYWQIVVRKHTWQWLVLQCLVLLRVLWTAALGEIHERLQNKANSCSWTEAEKFSSVVCVSRLF